MKADSNVSSGAAAVQKVCGGGGEGEGKTGSQGAEWPALKVEQSFENDRYRKFVAPGFCSASFEVVYPAEFKDVVKKRAVPLLRVKETKELYDAVTVPRMIANAAQKDAWVELILDGQKEAENVIFEDAEIMLVKDYKWQDEANLNELKYLVLFKDKTIRSLRDLDGDRHLELLERVQLEGEAKVIEKHFGIMLGTGATGVGAQAADGGDEAEGSEKCQGGATAPPQLMSYFHYHPTFWYLHVHICSTRHSMFENEEGLLLTDRLVKLDTVVDVLRVSPKYYEAATLTTALREPVAAWYGVR